MAHRGGNINPGHPMPGVPDARPRSAVLLWIVALLIVAMMVAWGVKRFGGRSSAEQNNPGSTVWPADSDDNVQPVTGTS